VSRREELYSGPYATSAPDLLVNFHPEFRVSWESAVGGFANSLIADNMRKWSGDHIIDPDAVPGILFVNRKLSTGSSRAGTRVPPQSSRVMPNIIDLAPTILNHLGVPVPRTLEGESLL
jgi:predicted AlkP superfamily phosphohydrolase/phosphomutase